MSLAVWFAIGIVLAIIALVIATGFVPTKPDKAANGAEAETLPYPIMAHAPEDEEGHTPLHGMHGGGHGDGASAHEAGHSGTLGR